MYNKLFGYAIRVPPWRYEDEQNTCLASVMVLLDGAYRNGSTNELEVSLYLEWYE